MISRDRSHWLPSALVGSLLLLTSPSNFFLPVYFKETIGLSAAQIGLLFALQSVTGMLASFPAGVTSDRATSRAVVWFSLGGSALGFLGLALARSFTALLPAFLIWALAYATFRLSLDVQVLKTDDRTRSGGRMATYQAFRFAGLFGGTLLAGWLMDELSFPTTLILCAVACALLLVPALRLPPTPRTPSRLTDYRSDLKNPGVLAFLVWMYLFSTHWGAEATCYGLFLREDLGLSLTGIGYYMCVEFGVIAGLVLFIGPRMDRAVGRSWFVLGLFLSGIGHIGMVAPNVWESVAFRALHGVGDAIIMMVMYVGVARLFSLERVGGNAGLVNTVTMLGSVTGALVFSPMGEAFGYGWPLGVSGFLTVLLILPILMLNPRHATY